MVAMVYVWGFFASILAFIGTCCAGTSVFSVTQKPEEVNFSLTSSALPVSELDRVLRSVFQLDGSCSEGKWDGLIAPTSPFYQPSAGVLFKVPGLPQPLHLNAQFEAPVIEDAEFDGPSANLKELEAALRGTYGENSLIVRLDRINTVRDLQDSYKGIMEGLKVSPDQLIHRLQSRTDIDPQFTDLLQLIDRPPVYRLLAEVDIMWQVIHKLHHAYSSKDSTKVSPAPDLIVFEFTHLQEAVEELGAQSAHTAEVVTFLQRFITKTSAIFTRIYNNNVLVSTLTSDVDSLDRKSPLKSHANEEKVPLFHIVKRATNNTDNSTAPISADTANDTDTNSTNMEPAPSVSAMPSPNLYVGNQTTFGVSQQGYSNDFTAIFHIILWLMVFMFLVVLFVAYGMWHMDPGRDSIIYRMTNQRMKKE